MTKKENIAEYWEEAEVLADALMPIPPRVCLDSDGVVIKTDRCLQCPMKAMCKMRTG